MSSYMVTGVTTSIVTSVVTERMIGGDKVEDEEIVAMFFQRSESALKAVSQKYGGLCYTVSDNILHNA